MAAITGFALFLKNALKYGFSLFGLPKTGQTISYEDFDDGYYKKGYPKIGARYTDNGDGTITDNATGLMWQKDGAAGPMTFEEAIAYAEALDLAGHSDWRLPNTKELQSIVNYGRVSPAIGESTLESPWVNTQSDYYWSSTTDADNAGNAWNVLFYNGHVGGDAKDLPDYVRCVRQ